jgi:hypothetical protein
MIVLQLLYNFNNFFFFFKLIIGSVFLHVGPKYPMVDFEKKVVKVIQKL